MCRIPQLHAEGSRRSPDQCFSRTWDPWRGAVHRLRHYCGRPCGQVNPVETIPRRLCRALARARTRIALRTDRLPDGLGSADVVYWATRALPELPSAASNDRGSFTNLLAEHRDWHVVTGARSPAGHPASTANDPVTTAGGDCLPTVVHVDSGKLTGTYGACVNAASTCGSKRFRRSEQVLPVVSMSR